MAKLKENQAQVKPVSEQLRAVLNDGADDFKAREAAVNFLSLWDQVTDLEIQYQSYLDQYNSPEINIDDQNQAQQQLSAAFKPFFDNFHVGLKQLDKTVRAHEAGDKKRGLDKLKELKSTLETLHEEVKSAELFFNHIQWLQERFPHAKYEDVTGLCKLATLAEVKEQDYSLNPGRYVGVVIEEDGKTEEEFIEEILGLNQELEKLNQEVHLLEGIIAHNMKEIAGDL